MQDLRSLMADTKFYESYSRYIDDEERYETWDEAVSRVMRMHKRKYSAKIEASKQLEELINFAELKYKEKYMLGAQRALQYGGEQLLKHEMKMYNCVSSHLNRVPFMGEFTYMLLCGAGAGASIQLHHVAMLPEIRDRSEEAFTHTIEDSIEGWATAIDILTSSYFSSGGKFPEYSGHPVKFDFSEIRPKGSKISGGFLAPGPEPLRNAINLIEDLLDKTLSEGIVNLRPIHVYDICMFIADAVISGGVRRSATIFLFSLEDKEMMEAKTGNWLVTNPQRKRSNNSVVLVKNEVTKKQLSDIIENIKQFGEPGFVLVDDKEFTYNPCVEIGKRPVTESGITGWQGCNLNEINGALCTTKRKFLDACKAAAILGTLQAGFTSFKFLPKETKEIFDREALLGVSITGWVNNPEILFNKEILQEGAQLVLETNKKVARLIGINPAARTTCTKPSGNASVLLETASGIHGEHSPRYIRNVQLPKNTEVARLLEETNPTMVSDSVWSSDGSDYCISFPIIPPEGSVYKKDLLGIKQLELVKLAQENWVEYGTDTELCVDPRLRHNVSNTITVDNWDEVVEYIYDNRQVFAGISLMAANGDKAYPQAPFTEVKEADDIISEYGPCVMFASGLIVDALHAFDNDLFLACDTANGFGLELNETDHKDLLKVDWVRRFKKFARNYLANDLIVTANCLKDVNSLYLWEKIMLNYQDIDWVEELKDKKFTEVDTLGAIACSGGTCEVNF